MKRIRRTSQFKKDIKRMIKRGHSLEQHRDVLMLLAAGKPLPSQYSDHPLWGQYEGTRECHLEPDWLLIYETNLEELILIRSGTHADLFR